MSDHNNDLGGDETMVHALLDEELGTHRMRSETADTKVATIVARFAAGDGAAAARRAQAADVRYQQKEPAWLATHWRALCAAAALLTVAATFAQSWVASPAEQGRQDPQERPGQDPKQVPPPTAKLTFAEFQEMLTRVQDVHVEPLRMADYSLPFPVKIPGTLRAYLPHSREPFLATLPKGVRKLDKLDAEWMNRVTFLLKDGRRVLGSIYPFPKRMITGEPAAGVRLHVQGLDCDVRLGKEASAMLRELLKSTTTMACHEQGVVLAPLSLASFPATTQSLRLFRLDDDALSGLDRYQGLRRLDCSGLQKTLGEKGLRNIAKACPKLEELVLDGMRLPDQFVPAIAELGKLKALSLRNVPNLTDKSVQRICELGLEELLLQGSGHLLTERALEHLAKASELTRLGVPKWPLPGLQQSSLIERLVSGDLELIKP